MTRIAGKYGLMSELCPGAWKSSASWCEWQCLGDHLGR